jgi:hypothetical protein
MNAEFVTVILVGSQDRRAQLRAVPSIVTNRNQCVHERFGHFRFAVMVTMVAGRRHSTVANNRNANNHK